MNVRSVLSATALAAGLCAVPGAASAAPAPSYLGPTGYILTPNAQVTPGSCANIGAHVFDPPLLSDSLVTAAHVNIGIANYLELGYTRLSFHGDIAEQEFSRGRNLANAKLSILPPTSAFQLAGGVLDAFDELFRTAYVVGQFNVGEKMSKSMKFIPRSLSVGAGWGTSSAGPLGEGRLSPIDGIWVNGGFSPARWLELHGEWMDNNGQVNTGLRIRPSGKLSGLVLDLAAMNVTGVSRFRRDVLVDRDLTWAGGLSYQFCFGKGKKHHDGEDEGKDEKTAPAPAPPAGK